MTREEIDCISREQAKASIRDKFKDLPSRVEINTILNELPSITLQESKWIPCSERLPNESGKYWCTFSETNLMGIDFYTTESYAKKWFDEPEEYIGWESKNVSAWMPLPEPYKE